MKEIIITENAEEMVRIGREIYNEKQDIYTDELSGFIREKALNICKRWGGTLDEAIYRSIYDYWVYGNSVEEEFYYKFYEKSHAEKSTYLTSKSRWAHLDHLNVRSERHLLDNKYETYQELKEYFKRDMILIRGEEDYDLFCDFVKEHPSFVVKPTNLALAQGVHKAEVTAGNEGQVFEKLLQERLKSGKDFGPMVRQRAYTGTIVLEQIIEQDDHMASMHPASANGVRCTTIRVGDTVHVYRPWFKIGVNGEFITGGAVGSLLAGINAETGIVDTCGFSENLDICEYHPTTGVKIPGFVIPKWDELLEILDKIGRHYPNVRYIGWDMVLSKKGWCIMEGNFGGQPMWQLMYQKGLKDEFEQLIGWKSDKTFWWE